MLQLFNSRLFLFTVFLVILNQQVSAQKYHYAFKIDGVDNIATAKEVTDPVRIAFNPGTNPFLVYPAFNEENQLFDFFADVLLSREDLEAVIRQEGIILLSFDRSLNQPESIDPTKR